MEATVTAIGPLCDRHTFCILEACHDHLKQCRIRLRQMVVISQQNLILKAFRFSDQSLHEHFHNL